MNAHRVLTRADPREELEAWCGHYNEKPPFGAIGNKVPISLQKHLGAAGPPECGFVVIGGGGRSASFKVFSG